MDVNSMYLKVHSLSYKWWFNYFNAHKRSIENVYSISINRILGVSVDIESYSAMDVSLMLLKEAHWKTSRVLSHLLKIH